MRELKNSSQKLLAWYEMIFHDVKCKKHSPIKKCDIVVITTKPLSISLSEMLLQLENLVDYPFSMIHEDQ